MSAPEDLLAALVGAPGGLDAAAAARAAGGAGAVPDAVAELRRRGHGLEMLQTGLRLQCAGEHFDPSVFRRVRRGGLGAVLEVWEQAPSSNDLARAGAGAGAPDGAVWLVEQQSAGRGRQGRSWQCPAHAGLLFSFLLRDSLAPARRPTLLPLAVGVGAREGVREATGVDVRTKWPNDLWIEDRKAGGILVEARAGSHAVVGMGLNVMPAALDPSLPQATTLAAYAAPVRREILLAAILAAVGRRLEDWRAGRFDVLLAAWSEADRVLGRHIEVDTGHGCVAGRAVAVSSHGLLQLEIDGGGRMELAAGEVHLR